MKQNKALSFEKYLNIKTDTISSYNNSIPKNNISVIKSNNTEKINSTEKRNKKDIKANIFLTENNLSQSLGKIFKSKNKIKLIKNLLTPSTKNYIFDGYL